MEELLRSWLNEDTNGVVLFIVIVASLVVLAKSADWLVHAAVGLSVRTGLPKVVIGVTIVSLGTTCPEAVVSVMAAVGGNPGLALGNAVGSIICDTGLILGLAATLSPLPLDRVNVPRQSWLQLGVGCLLVLACWPLREPLAAFDRGGNLPQIVGVVFLVLLGCYFWLSMRWARRQRGALFEEDVSGERRKRGPGPGLLVLRLIGALALVVLSSWVLIPAVEGSAMKLGVDESIIAATLVAFGTSLPELVTAIAATLRGHGELAIGNVIGADILNVLFVAGASAAATRGGLDVAPHFFTFYFPVMLAVLVLLRCGIACGRTELRRRFGITLLAIYGVYLVLNTLFFVRG